MSHQRRHFNVGRYTSWYYFDRWVLGHPRWVLLLGLMTVWFAIQMRYFRLDASAETLMLENDRDLRYAREIAQRYGNGDFLVVAYRPRGDLLSDPVLADLNDLCAELGAVDGVSSVVSILDVPLLESPPVTLKELSAGVHTLTSVQTDRRLARLELAASPLYRELLVSPDLGTTALLVHLRSDPVVKDLMQRRQMLWDRQVSAGRLIAAERAQLDQVQAALREQRDRQRRTDRECIAAVRRILRQHVGHADLVLGGVGMITHDMVGFINYFKSSTEIYRGMSLIDRESGGTTPLDVIVDLAPSGPVASPASATLPAEVAEVNDPALFAEYERTETGAKQWFTPGRLARVRVLHDLLCAQPEVGKVLSLAVPLQLAERLNRGRSLDAFDLNLLFNETPAALRRLLVDPYVSVEHNQVRFWVRIRDSRPDLRRHAFLQRLQRELVQQGRLTDQQVHLTSTMVLYNNMLQSLFRSQILTLGLTVLLLTGMFLLLFRSWRLALIVLLPNLLPIAVMLGVMGWLDLPLDMMTITIAAISVGIAVDDTIHYIHRFRVEFVSCKRYVDTMHLCHRRIGHAMTYTSITIIIGFGILGLSNFIPTIAFGLLTGLVMLIAMVTAQTLLPQLILMIRPFGAEMPCRQAS